MACQGETEGEAEVVGVKTAFVYVGSSGNETGECLAEFREINFKRTGKLLWSGFEGFDALSVIAVIN